MDVVDASKAAKVINEGMMQGNVKDIDWTALKPFLIQAGKHIREQKKRIGGNFAVAQAVTSREMRDAIRVELPDCTFITLTLTKEAQKKRIIARHGDMQDNIEGLLQLMTGMYDLYELPGEGELNTYNVDITEEMSQMDVMNEVLTILEENCPEK